MRRSGYQKSWKHGLAGWYFGRSIRNAKKKGRAEERKRIIALLDEAFIYEEPVVIERARLIALIKGESK